MKIVLWAVRLCMAVLVSHNIMPVIKNNIYGKHYPQPPPILVSGEEEYEIKVILKHQYCRLRSGV
jgi:hypothetical protein